MAKRVQRLGHTTALADAFTGLAREITLDVTRNELRAHDGFTLGGHPVAKGDATNIQDATGAQNGRMTIAHVNQLDTATAGVAQNAADIAANAADIAANIIAIGDVQADTDTKIPRILTPTVGRLLSVDGTGALVEDAKLATDVPTIQAAVRALFFELAAPSGWSLHNEFNDRVIRINTGGGTGVGGSWTITGLSSGLIPVHVLTISEMPAHNHPVTITQGKSGDGGTDSYARPGVSPNSSGITMSNRGGSGGHSHDAPAISYTPGWRPSYVDAIVCARNP